MAFWSQDATSTDPPSYTTTAQEDVTLTITTTPLLVSGGAPSAPSSLLYQVVDNAADVAVTLTDTPTVNGNVISQRIRNLTANTTYRLRVSFTTSGQVRSMTTFLVVTE